MSPSTCHSVGNCNLFSLSSLNESLHADGQVETGLAQRTTHPDAQATAKVRASVARGLPNVSLTLESTDYVNRNPGAFADAYFEFLWVMVYE
jgi:hypothetical protein